MQQICKGIFMVTCTGGISVLKPPVNIYIIPGNNGMIFDAGYGDRRSVNFLMKEISKIRAYCRKHSMGTDISQILVSHSHPDHFSGLYELKKKLKASVLLTPAMSRLITSKKEYRKSYEETLSSDESKSYKHGLINMLKPAVEVLYEKNYGTRFLKQADVMIDDDSYISINNKIWKVFPSPGHCDDHISLYNQETGVLFAGDNILRSITTWLGPPRSSLTKYLSSLLYMKNLPGLKIILTAHGSPVLKPKQRIKQIIRWRELRTLQVYSVIKYSRQKSLSVGDIVKKIYKGQGWIKYKMAEGWIRLTLDHLEFKGRILSDNRKNKRVYYCSS